MTVQQLHREGLQAFESGDFESASRLFWNGLQLSESSELWNDWATARLQMGERSVAEQGFRRALDLDQRSPEAAVNLGILLAGTNRYAEAISYLDRVNRNESEPQVVEILAWCQQQMRASAVNSPREGVSARSSHAAGGNIILFPDRADTTPLCATHSQTAVTGIHGEGQPEQPHTSATARVHKGVVFEGIVYGGSGYADESVCALMGLHRRGARIRLVSTNQQEDVDSILPAAVNQTLDEMKTTRLDLAGSLHLHSAPAHDFLPGIHARRRIGRTMFETDRIPDSWLDRCQMMDEIWVPSEFNRETFHRAGVDERKLHVMNAGIDTELFRPGLEPFPLPIQGHFKFLSVFEWTARKGPDILLRAFLREFKRDEGAALVLRTYARPDPSVDLVPRIAHFIEREAGLTIEEAPPILVVFGFMKASDMPRLYNAADAFVLPSRGEGYGRPYMEALACGLPVIGTGWSGQTDFLSEENSYPVEIEGIVPVPDTTEVDTYFGHCWAQPSVEDLQQKMRKVFSDREEARRKGKLGRAEMVERWDWETVLNRWHQRIEYLLD